MATLTNEILQLTSTERFLQAANYNNSNFLILVADDAELGLKENAELLDVTPIKNQPPITARVTFRIDRAANGLPFNEKPLNKRYFSRKILVKQILASEIVKDFGINGVVYLSLTTVPATTKLLAARLNELYHLNIAQSDIEDQIIPTGAECIVVRFSTMSVGFAGSFKVNLTTPVTNVG